MFIKKVKIKTKYILREFFSIVIWKFINWRDKRRLKNHNFTILCSTCIGGIIYHKLQEPFLTPTINLWMKDNDLIKFALNLENYIKETELQFIASEYDHPVAKIKDITIYFNHCKTEEEAIKQWFKRVGRINKENLFVIASDRCSDIEEKEFVELFSQIECKGKVLFTSKDNYKEEFELYLPYYKGEDKVGIYMLDRGKNYYKIAPYDGYFDYVYFLNSGEIKRKHNVIDKILIRLGTKDKSYN